MAIECSQREIFVVKKKKKISLYQSQRGIHAVAARAAPGDLGLNVSSEGLVAEIDILLRSPIQVQTKANVA